MPQAQEAMISMRLPVCSHAGTVFLFYDAGQMGEGGEHLQQAAADDIDSYKKDVAPDGVDEHDALIAKLRDETNAAQGKLPTESATTGKWQ